jgi:hypothetical protein
MLTNSDYRAAIYQAYRALRHESTLRNGQPYMTKKQAFAHARAIIKPLPEDRQARILREAFVHYERYRCNNDCYFIITTPRQTWRIAHTWARIVAL